MAFTMQEAIQLLQAELGIGPSYEDLIKEYVQQSVEWIAEELLTYGKTATFDASTGTGAYSLADDFFRWGVGHIQESKLGIILADREALINTEFGSPLDSGVYAYISRDNSAGVWKLNLVFAHGRSGEGSVIEAEKATVEYDYWAMPPTIGLGTNLELATGGRQNKRLLMLTAKCLCYEGIPDIRDMEACSQFMAIRDNVELPKARASRNRTEGASLSAAYPVFPWR